MNYLKQINSFYRLLPVKPLSTNAQCLYNVLLHINNMCNWQKEFTVANLTLMGFTSLNKQALYRARNELIQANLIKFKKGINQNQAGKYQIIEFVTADDTADDTANNTADDTASNTANDTINKQNKTKQKETKSSSLYDEDVQKIDELMIECLGSTNLSNEKECIDEYLPELPIDVIEYALRETARRSGNWQYAKAILENYKKQGLNTLEKVKAEALKFKNKGKKEETIEEEAERLRKKWGLEDGN